MRTEIKIQLIVLVSLLVSMTPANSANKSDKIKPKWLTQVVPESQSGSYMFVRSHGEGSSFSGAKQMAFIAMTQKLEIERGLTVNTNVHTSEFLRQTQSESETEYKQEITLDVTENGRKLEIVCREIDDYWVERDGEYWVDVLYAVVDKNSYGGSYDDDIVVTTRYGAAGLLSIVPSVGQFYKGSMVKGSLILAGEIVAVGGIVLCENTRASYIKKMYEQPKYASEYNSLADSWKTGRNICIGVAAAVYVYNLIDALTTNGAKRVIVKDKLRLVAAPYADNNSFGVGLALNF